MPAHDYGAAGDINQPGSLAFFPHVRRRDERVDGAGLGAINPLDERGLHAGRGSARPGARTRSRAGAAPGSTAVALVLPLRCVLTVGCTTFLPPRALILPTV